MMFQISQSWKEMIWLGSCAKMTNDHLAEPFFYGSKTSTWSNVGIRKLKNQTDLSSVCQIVSHWGRVHVIFVFVHFKCVHYNIMSCKYAKQFVRYCYSADIRRFSKGRSGKIQNWAWIECQPLVQQQTVVIFDIYVFVGRKKLRLKQSHDNHPLKREFFAYVYGRRPVLFRENCF